MKKVDDHLIFTVDLYNVSLKEYVHGYSMTGFYINECYDALNKFEFELNEIIKLDSNSKFDILRFIFRKDELLCSFDISKIEYISCKCSIVWNIFNLLQKKFYGKPDNNYIFDYIDKDGNVRRLFQPDW